MASTKQMQDRARAKKSAQKQPVLNDNEFLKAVLHISKILVEHDRNQTYNSTEMMQEVARDFINHPKNGLRGHRQQVTSVTRQFGEYLIKKYDLEIAGGACAFVQDLELHMQEQGVPQVQRVALGLMDLIGGMLMLTDVA